MSKRWFVNFCAVCAAIVICLAILALVGCADVSMTKEGENVTWRSKTLFKDISEVDAIAADGQFNFNLGSSTSELSTEQMQALACVLNPGSC